jgi:hypothetical protein
VAHRIVGARVSAGHPGAPGGGYPADGTMGTCDPSLIVTAGRRSPAPESVRDLGNSSRGISRRHHRAVDDTHTRPGTWPSRASGTAGYRTRSVAQRRSRAIGIAAVLVACL